MNVAVADSERVVGVAEAGEGGTAEGAAAAATMGAASVELVEEVADGVEVAGEGVAVWVTVEAETRAGREEEVSLDS